MKLAACDNELDRLRTASERVAANLVELELGSSRQLLEASTLSGESLERTFAQAHHALYTAPTDLAAAAQLVRRYQERLNTAHEVLR